MRISDWSSDVCSSDLTRRYYPSGRLMTVAEHIGAEDPIIAGTQDALDFLAERTGETAYVGCVDGAAVKVVAVKDGRRSEEHTSELQSLMRISYAVFCLKKKKHKQ